MKYSINKYIFIVFIGLIGFVGYLQYKVVENTNLLKTQEISKTISYAANIISYLKTKVPDNLQKRLEQDPKLREELNGILQAFITDKYKYIFVVEQSHKKYFRFLLDGSSNSPEVYHAIFFPKSKAYKEVYITQDPKIIKQKDEVENVWLSLLYPIVYDGKTEALLVIDLSKVYGEYLEDFNLPLTHTIIIMQVVLVLVVLAFIIAYIKYQNIRNKLIQDHISKAYTKQYLVEFLINNSIQDYNILLLDIDGFKVINTKYGHEVGDKFLKEFVSFLYKLVKNENHQGMVFRQQGGEFVILIPKGDYQFKNFVKFLFESLQSKKYLINNEIIQITVSISALYIAEDINNLDRILRILDELLLEVKSMGKNNYKVLDVDDSNLIRYKDIDFIKQLLEDNKVQCVYQPIYDIQNEKISKFETLVRLYDEEADDYISPSFFMDMIRGTSQYIKMSRLVFKEIFETLKKYPHIELSVNLHLDDLYNQEMMNTIINHLHKYKNDAKRLTFEILEDKEIQDFARVEDIFQTLKKYGSKIAIDDFGSGYSNYIYLIKLDVDIVKLDGSLIQELMHNKSDAILTIKYMKKMIEGLGYDMIVEFVSESEIYDDIVDLGIQYAQGYYLGEPKLISEYVD